MAKRRFKDLPSWARTAILTAASVQLSLTATALVDIARRPAAQINGPKWCWRLLAFVNFLGPILYFSRGRRRAEVESAS